MPEREKVIKGLESCTGVDCTECQYGTEGHGHKDCVERLCADALALLKEQEVKMSVCDKCGLEHPADDWYCPRCGKSNFD